MAISQRQCLLRLFLLRELIISFILLINCNQISSAVGSLRCIPLMNKGSFWDAMLIIHNKMEKSKRKHQFQIRKVPLHRVLPSKTPELYALDVHSICLPSRSKKAINWGIHCEHQYEESFNPQVIYSPAYQDLHARFLALKEQQAQERHALKQEIEAVEETIAKEEDKEERLQNMRQGLYSEIESLRKQLNEVRDKNYNLRWQIYHQRGAHYMNANGYSLLHDGEMTYEELLQIEEQIGSIPKGLSESAIAQLPTQTYKIQDTKEICCICFDQIQEGEQILALKCRHYHHSQCLRDWLLKQRVCPICKQVVGA